MRDKGGKRDGPALLAAGTAVGMATTKNGGGAPMPDGSCLLCTLMRTPAVGVQSRTQLVVRVGVPLRSDSAAKQQQQHLSNVSISLSRATTSHGHPPQSTRPLPHSCFAPSAQEEEDPSDHAQTYFRSPKHGPSARDMLLSTPAAQHSSARKRITHNYAFFPGSQR